MMTYRPHICPFEALIPLVPRGARVLDVGCGGGLMLSLLAASGRIQSGKGFDTNTSMIDLATRVAEQHDLPLDYETRSVADGFPAGHFDAISIIDVMHHIPPSAQAVFLQQAIEQLPPGGMLIYKDMCRQPSWRAAMNRLHDLVLTQQWIHYCPIDTIKQWAVEPGLELELERTYDRLWYGHELVVLSRPA
ncbi:MAG: class I SAM-dependent methyltransferase [Planctomycetota bacterium]